MNPSIYEKSQIPSTDEAKKAAWKPITDKYSSVIEKIVNEIQLKKFLSSIKSSIILIRMKLEIEKSSLQLGRRNCINHSAARKILLFPKSREASALEKDLLRRFN